MYTFYRAGSDPLAIAPAKELMPASPMLLYSRSSVLRLPSDPLAALKSLYVDGKLMRHPQLVAACRPRGIAIG